MTRRVKPDQPDEPPPNARAVRNCDYWDTTGRDAAQARAAEAAARRQDRARADEEG